MFATAIFVGGFIVGGVVVGGVMAFDMMWADWAQVREEARQEDNKRRDLVSQP